MKAILAVLAATGLLITGPVNADVLKDKGCVKCHDAEKKKMGPSIKDIAAKHQGKGDEAALVARLKDGKGHPKSKESEADLKAAVQEMLK